MNELSESTKGEEGTDSVGATHSIPHILVVEDDPLVRELSAEVLTRSGFHVDTAADGEAGLKAAHQDASGYDLIITDNQMPKLSGVELIETLRSEHTNTPIILASGSVPAKTDHLHLNAILRKPFFAHQLIETVKQVLFAAAHPACSNL